jgi:hypothetical protein
VQDAVEGAVFATDGGRELLRLPSRRPFNESRRAWERTE